MKKNSFLFLINE